MLVHGVTQRQCLIRRASGPFDSREQCILQNTKLYRCEMNSGRVIPLTINYVMLSNYTNYVRVDNLNML